MSVLRWQHGNGRICRARCHPGSVAATSVVKLGLGSCVCSLRQRCPLWWRWVLQHQRRVRQRFPPLLALGSAAATVSTATGASAFGLLSFFAAGLSARLTGTGRVASPPAAPHLRFALLHAAAVRRQWQHEPVAAAARASIEQVSLCVGLASVASAVSSSLPSSAAFLLFGDSPATCMASASCMRRATASFCILRCNPASRCQTAFCVHRQRSASPTPLGVDQPGQRHFVGIRPALHLRQQYVYFLRGLVP